MVPFLAYCVYMYIEVVPKKKIENAEYLDRNTAFIKELEMFN